jgi:GNAT superfamily N-acetyltransferase
MIIRIAEKTDAPRIARHNMMLAEETEDWQPSYEDALQGSKELIDHYERGFYLVAEHDGELVGQLMVTIEWSDWRNKEIWWIHRIFVKQEWRHQGVFTHLLEELKKMAEKRNVFVLRLYVMNSNQKAISIYLYQGWLKTPFSIFQQYLQV